MLRNLLSSLLLLLSLASAYLYAGDDFVSGFKPMNEPLKTKEDFLKIYNQWLYSDLDSTSRNIYFLELAYVAGYNHPIQALTTITNEIQFDRYKYLLQMHICTLLTQEYINYGYFFVKEHVYFYNQEFKTNYLNGYDVAEFYFNGARKYWNEAVSNAQFADSIKGWRTDLNYYEDEIYRIKTGDLNYYKVLDNLMVRVNNNRAEITRLWGTN